MMIPISKAFTALKTRLECVSLDPRASLAVEAQDAKEASGASESEDKEIKEYLALFQNAMNMIDKSNNFKVKCCRNIKFWYKFCF